MDKYEALKNGLQSLIEQMKSLVANGDYKEDEEMESKDVSSVMDDVEKDVNEMEPNPLHDEMRRFMKSKNLGDRPKGLKAIMIEAKVKNPMKMDMGFKKQGKR